MALAGDAALFRLVANSVDRSTLGVHLRREFGLQFQCARLLFLSQGSMPSPASGHRLFEHCKADAHTDCSLDGCLMRILSDEIETLRLILTPERLSDDLRRHPKTRELFLEAIYTHDLLAYILDVGAEAHAISVDAILKGRYGNYTTSLMLSQPQFFKRIEPHLCEHGLDWTLCLRILCSPTLSQRCLPLPRAAWEPHRHALIHHHVYAPEGPQPEFCVQTQLWLINDIHLFPEVAEEMRRRHEALYQGLARGLGQQVALLVQGRVADFLGGWWRDLFL